jgi:hypothetical protein
MNVEMYEEKTLTLKDTVDLMLSSDFKDRGIAEYLQISIRAEQNRAFIENWKQGKLTFTPCNTLEQSELQLKAMELYKYTLRERLKSVFGVNDEEFDHLVASKL